MKKSLLGKAKIEYMWDEKFFVLSNLGLIIMEKPNSEKFDFWPYNEFKVFQPPDDKYSRSFCVELIPIIAKKQSKEHRMVLSANSSDQIKTWVGMLTNQQKFVFSYMHN